MITRAIADFVGSTMDVALTYKGALSSEFVVSPPAMIIVNGRVDPVPSGLEPTLQLTAWSGLLVPFTCTENVVPGATAPVPSSVELTLTVTPSPDTFIPNVPPGITVDTLPFGGSFSLNVCTINMSLIRRMLFK